MGFAVDGLRLRSRPEQTGHIGMAFRFRGFGENLVTVRGVGFALEGGVQVVERLLGKRRPWRESP